MTSQVVAALSRKTITAVGMFTLGSAASAPLVVLVGGIVAIYAGTQVQSLPLLILIIGTVVAFLAVGYSAMSREVPHAAAYYAILSRGLNRAAGVAGGMVALLAYNAIQISLYGLLGFTLSGLVGGPWWMWALLGLAVVGVVGVRPIAVSTRLLAVILVISLVIVLLAFVPAALLSPADGASIADGFDPGGLVPDGALNSGLGGAAALTLAAFMGLDAPGSFSEEAVDEHAVSKGTIGGIITLAIVYSMAALAMLTFIGKDDIAAVAGDPEGGLPFSVFEEGLGTFMTPVVQFFLVLAILTSMLAFHNVIARYAFAMAREGVLPAGLARTGATGVRVSAPVGGSLLQTAIAAVVVIGAILVGADPLTGLFTWLSTLGALGLLTLLLACSVAAIVYFSGRTDRRPALWVRVVAPLLGITGGGFVLAAMLTSMGSLLGSNEDYVTLILPAIVVATVAGGLLWAVHLRQTRPDIFVGISQGRPEVYDMPDDTGIKF